MTKVSTLEIRHEQRPGGTQKPDRTFLDFVVDGVSLWSQLAKAPNLDAASCLWLPKIDLPDVQILLLKEPSDFPNNRRSLYACPGCGIVTVVIEAVDTTITWRDFGYQHDWESEVSRPDAFRDLGPYVFNRNAYENLFADLLR